MRDLANVLALYEPCEEGMAAFIAQDWHGGQASSLYALASTGTILPGALEEARHAWETAADLSFEDDYAIGSLVAYLATLRDDE